jgi:hypothetical protein
MAVAWCNGWHEVPDERHRLYIERELGWELDQVQGHPLRGQSFRVVAALNTYDDFILHLEEGQGYAYVHLVWKPAPPPFRPLGDEEALQQFIREWKSD